MFGIKAKLFDWFYRLWLTNNKYSIIYIYSIRTGPSKEMRIYAYDVS